MESDEHLMNIPVSASLSATTITPHRYYVMLREMQDMNGMHALETMWSI